MKDKILLAARELFTLYGYKKVSVDEIAKLTGTTKKTIYSYFKDKESILVEITMEELKKMKDIITSCLNENSGDFSLEVNEIIMKLINYKKETKLFITLSKEANELNNITSKNSINMIDEAIMNFIKERLTVAIDKGYVRKCNVDLCSFIIYKIYIAIMFEYDGDIDEKEISNNVSKILKEGLLN